MNSLNSKLIVYDGACPLCTRLKELGVLLGLFDEQRCKPYLSLPEHLQRQVEAERFRSEMALIDLHGAPTLYGLDGIIFVLDPRRSGLTRVVSAAWLYPGLRALYRLVANNRYFLATPRFDMPGCSCTLPPNNRRLRLIYLALALTIATLMTVLFAAVLQKLLPGVNVVAALLMTGSGWLLQGIWAMLIRPADADAYLGHLASVMSRGVLWLMIPIVWLMLGLPFLPFLTGVAVAVSFATMLRQHVLRIRFLAWSQWWSVAWSLHLWCAGLAWLLFFVD